MKPSLSGRKALQRSHEFVTSRAFNCGAQLDAVAKHLEHGQLSVGPHILLERQLGGTFVLDCEKRNG